jgi:hypothetical protein
LTVLVDPKMVWFFHGICLPLESARTAVCYPRAITMSCIGVDSQPYKCAPRNQRSFSK